MTGNQSASLGAIQQDAGRKVSGTLSTAQYGAVFGPGGLGSMPYQSGSLSLDFVAKGAIMLKGNGSYNLTLDSSKQWGTAHTAAEFRPLNAAVLFCIKHD
jgi:hypothetical protein